MEKYVFKEETKAFMESSLIPYAVYQFIDNRVVTLILSDGFCKLFGYDDKAEAYLDMDRDMYRETHPDDVARIANEAFRFATEGGTYEVVYRTKKQGGSEYKMIHAIGEHFYPEEGVRLAHVWYMDEGKYNEGSEYDDSQLNRTVNNAIHEERFLQEHHYDQLTGLPVMAYFFKLAKDGFKAIRRSGDSPVILYFDLIGMKFFNKRHSFSAGDKLLCAFAKVLSRTFSNENCCHVSGDHFVVFTGEEGLESTLRKMFLESREINGGNSLPVRVGIYQLSMEEVPVSIACDRAKIACDMLRKSYGSGYNYYNQSLLDDLEKRQYILDHLDKAIEEGWIQVYYQPIIRAVNGMVCDEEALARWIDPVMGFLSPADFIPTLEDSGLIYKLDLCVVDQVLKKIRRMQQAGIHIVPQSINLSRSDFVACDIVEEIRSRVDAAGVRHDNITIEITESVIGGDFDFMKQQVNRFRKLGFPVWMDDFGSGYSSMDVLQGIRFDLLKFDMSFLRRLNEGERGKIILTEMMKMATALGLDTVCEGVETEEQVQFLREIGCSKLQGFYFGRPIPLERLIAQYDASPQIIFENTDESEYFESIGRLSLYDLTVIASEDSKAFRNALSAPPMGILEILDGKVKLVRTNESFRGFIERFYGYYPFENEICAAAPFTAESSFMKQVNKCREEDSRVIFDEKMPDGSTVHYFAGWVDSNPLTNANAVAVSVLSIADRNEGATYADIARALAADFYNIYYVDLVTDDFIEYSSPVGKEELAMERHGKKFFEAAQNDTLTRIFEEDREAFLKIFSKENILRELDTHGVFTATYRLVDNGTPMYVNMKITYTLPDRSHIILGISIIDFQMKEREAKEKLKREQLVYERIAALAGNYLILYTIDPVTDDYYECHTTADFDTLGLAKKGVGFFERAVTDGMRTIYPDDLPAYLEGVQKDTIMKAVSRGGLYTLSYHLVINGKPVPVELKAALVQESDGEKLILGVSKIG